MAKGLKTCFLPSFLRYGLKRRGLKPWRRNNLFSKNPDNWQGDHFITQRVVKGLGSLFIERRVSHDRGEFNPGSCIPMGLLNAYVLWVLEHHLTGMPGEAESICAEPWSRTWRPVCLPSWVAYRWRGYWAFGKQKGIPLSSGWRHIPAPAQRSLIRTVLSARQACFTLFNPNERDVKTLGVHNPAHIRKLEDSRPSWGWGGWGSLVHMRAAEAVM